MLGCEGLLRKVAREEGLGEDFELQVTGGSEPGSNFHGDVKKVKISGGGKSLALVIKKSLGGDPIARKLQRTREKFENEIYFYENIAPFLKITLPKYYGSCLEVGEETVLLGEVEGYSMKKGRLDETHSKIVLEALAALHSATLRLGKENPGIFEPFKETFFPHHEDETCERLLGAFADTTFEEGLSAAKKLLGDDCFLWLRNLAKGDFLKEMRNCVTPKTTNDLVLTHGDVWSNNFLFKYSSEGVVEDVCILDWQMVRVGSGWEDVWQWVATSAGSPWRVLLTHYASMAPAPTTQTREMFYGLGMALFLLPFAAEPVQDFEALVSKASSVPDSKIEYSMKGETVALIASVIHLAYLSRDLISD